MIRTAADGLARDKPQRPTLLCEQMQRAAPVRVAALRCQRFRWSNAGGDAQIRTGDKGFAGLCLATWLRRRLVGRSVLPHVKKADRAGPVARRWADLRRYLGADDGIRTRDPNLGKVVLYQLSHVRAQGVDYHGV